MKRALSVFAAIVFCLSCLFPAPCPAAEITVNKIAAVVNGEMITLHDLRLHVTAEMARRRMPANDPKVEELQKHVLDSMINDILMRQEAKRFQITIGKSELDEEVRRMVSRSGRSAAQYEEDLKREGVSMDMFRDRIRDSMLRQRIASFMVQRRVFVTAEEVSAYYHNNPEKFKGERTIDFSVIMIPENLDAQRIYQDIKSGRTTFEDAARKYSADRSAQDGGLVSGVPWEKLPVEMKKLLSSLKDGSLSQLFKTRGGFIMFRRGTINEARPLTFEEARPRIEEELRAPLLEERFNEYIAQLRGKAVIDIRI